MKKYLLLLLASFILFSCSDDTATEISTKERTADQKNYIDATLDSNGDIIVNKTPKAYVLNIEAGQHMMSVGIPTDYYKTASSLSSTQLRETMHNIISTGAQKLSYTTVWTMCENADENPLDRDQVWLVYKEEGIAKYRRVSSYKDGWNREHTWAKSHGGFGTTAGAGTDGHHLRASDARENGNRGNLNFANVNGPKTKNSNFYEPPLSCKGDVARSIFFMAVRYGFTVDETGVIDKDKGMHGKLSDLLKWNDLDPVDAYEIRRNNIIYGFQKNRNPFIDHPELVKYIFGAKKNSKWLNN